MLKQDANKIPDRFANAVRESIDKEVKKGQDPTGKGYFFLKWALTKVFHETDDAAEDAILDGPNDYGIDAILEISGGEINVFNIFQSKFGTSHSIDGIRAFKAKMDEFLKLKPNDLKKGRIRDALIEIKSKEWECELVYVTDQIVEFPNKDNLHVYGFNQIIEKLWTELSEPAENKVETIRLEDFMKYGKNTIIGVVSLKELASLVNRTKKYIFESNIRKYLPVNTKVNHQLEESLKNEPAEVFYYNNGITIVVKEFEELDDKQIRLREPQIVNGAQTSSTVADVVRGDSNIIGSIQVTIIKEDSRTTRTNITKYRNSQNAVKGRDLISLEQIHNSIFLQLKTKLNYFYERQAGAWEALGDNRETYKGSEIFMNYLPSDHEPRIPANDAIQAMAAAMEQNPAKPYGSVSKYMPGGAEYERIFSKKIIEFDYRLFFYPYLVKEYCKKEFKYGTLKSDMQEKNMQDFFL